MKSAALIGLLQRHFTDGGRLMSSAVDTCDGTRKQWQRLVDAGLVEWSTKTGRGVLGHDFAVRLTKAGEILLGNEYSPYDFPFWCQTCGRCCETVKELIDHRQRKHAHIVPVFPLWTGHNAANLTRHFQDRKATEKLSATAEAHS